MTGLFGPQTVGGWGGGGEPLVGRARHLNVGFHNQFLHQGVESSFYEINRETNRETKVRGLSRTLSHLDF